MYYYSTYEVNPLTDTKIGILGFILKHGGKSCENQKMQWAEISEDFFGYHDTEWARAAFDDQSVFERLCLKAFNLDELAHNPQ